MRATGREAADRLLAAVVAQRRGAADELAAIHDLAVGYGIEVDDDLIDELLVSTVPGGCDGCPEVHEFVHLELCGLLGVTARHARSRVFETLNLYYRHPTLWAAVQDLQLDARRATYASARCGQLTSADADLVGRQWYHQQAGLSWKAAFDLLDRLIIEADPALAAKKDAEAAATREVILWGHRDNGCIDVTARMDALDAMYLDATVDQLADILQSDTAHAGTSKQALRAKALGIMATPAVALALQQQAWQQHVLQPSLIADTDPPQDNANAADSAATAAAGAAGTTGSGAAAGAAGAAGGGAAGAAGGGASAAATDAAGGGAASAAGTAAGDGVVGGGVVDPDTGRVDRDPHHCLGHVCGRVSVPPAKLAPKAKIYLHIDATDLTRFGGAALIEKVGWISSLSLKSVLRNVNVTIQPVIDLNTIPAEQQYRPTARMREAVQLMFPVEAFPYSHTSSRRCELDHTVAYQPSCRDAQTGIGMLAPLMHKTHHAKTVAAWLAQQRAPGEIVWTSPLGFQYLVTLERTWALETTARE